MTTKHTPGPWEATSGYSPEVRAGEALICAPKARTDGIGGQSLGEIKANASLIAAAPDLLEALKYARNIVAHDLGDDSAHLVPLDAAIAKAEGR